MVETTPKTKSGKRVITLAQFAINALKAQKVKQLEQRLQAGGSWMNKDLVFCSAIGDYYVVTSLTHQFKILLKKAELPPMRVHDLRHSAATLLLKMGVPAKVVQEILGHSSIVITMDVYSHILPGMQQSAMDQLDGLFLQAQ